MSTLKIINFTLEKDNCCRFADNFDLIFCICFKTEDQKMRHCAFMFFFLCNFATG